MPISDRPSGRPDNLEDSPRYGQRVELPEGTRPSLLRLADQLEETLQVVMPLVEGSKGAGLRRATTAEELPTGHGATVLDAEERAWSRNRNGNWARVDVPSIGDMAKWVQPSPTLPATVLCEGVEG